MLFTRQRGRKKRHFVNFIKKLFKVVDLVRQLPWRIFRNKAN